jgi:hypothetical protein
LRASALCSASKWCTRSDRCPTAAIKATMAAQAGLTVPRRTVQVIWEEMQGAVHAVDQMVCKTPEEAGL